MKRVIIAGMGPGSKSCITEELKEAIDNAEVLIGSKRLIEDYADIPLSTALNLLKYLHY